MAKAASSPVPEGFATVTPHMMVRNARETIDFYKKAFGAEEIMAMPGPDGKTIMHAEIKIGDSMIMLAEECPDMKGWAAPVTLKATTVGVCLYVDDADALFDRAVKAGAEVAMPMMDMFWGDRYGKVTDPSGHIWEIATHKQDLTAEECQKGAEAFFAQMAKGGACSA